MYLNLLKKELTAIEADPDYTRGVINESLEANRRARKEEAERILRAEKEAEDANLEFMDEVLTKKSQTVPSDETLEFESDEKFMDYVLKGKRGRR